MAEPARRRATYDDLLQLPPNLVGEVLSGQLHAHPRPAPKHALSASAVGAQLFGPFGCGRGGPGGWWILDEPELHLGADILVPDIAGWRRERMPSLPDEAWIELVPDWVCEVLSPSTAKLDRSVKVPAYAGYGVGFLWLVDPLLRTLEAYRLVDGRWTLVATLKDDDVAAVEPFEAIRIDLAELWV